MPGLHPHLAGRRLRRVAAGAAGGLHQQAEQALGRAEVAGEQGRVRVERGHQRDAAEVVALGDHLGAHQHVDVARVHARQLLLQRALEARAVGVHAGDAHRLAIGLLHVGQQVGQVFFQPFGAAAQRRDVDVAAGRAGARHALGVAAVVAAQRAVDLVEHAVGAAVRAFAFPVAGGAGQHRRIAAAVQEHQGLLAARDALLDRFEQLRREARCVWAAGSCPPAAPHGKAPPRLHRWRRRGPAPGLRARPSPAAGSGPSRRPASFPARAWPNPAAPWRLPACRGKRPGRAPNSARLPAACSWGRALRPRRSACRRGIEANTAMRVPSTMRAAPLCAASQLFRRWGGVMPLFIATTLPAPKRATKRSCSCGVRLISGTITSACACGSRSSSRCTACR